MASYNTATDVTDKIPNVTISTSTNPSTAHVNGYLGRAYARINSRLRKSYAVPFTAAPDEILQVELNLALADTLEHCYRTTQPDIVMVTMPMRKDALALLEQIATGTVSLGLDNSAPADPDEAGIPAVNSGTERERVFNFGDMGRRLSEPILSNRRQW